MITYGEMSAFERLVEDVKQATLGDKLGLSAMAAVEFGHVEPLLDRIARARRPRCEAMAPFVATFDVLPRATPRRGRSRA